MPIPKCEQSRQDAEYLRKHETHRLFNSIAMDLLADRPSDVLLYLKGWVTSQMESQKGAEDCDGEADEVDFSESSTSRNSKSLRPATANSSRCSELVGSYRAHAAGNCSSPLPWSSSGHGPPSRQSSVNMLRRAYPTTAPPETVLYSPATTDFEAMAESTGASRAMRDSIRFEPSTNGKGDWRPSPVTLRVQFPDPKRHFVLTDLISSGHYGSVYKGIKLDSGETFAVKKVAIDGHWVLSEYENLVHCASPHVVGSEGCYYNEEEDMLWIVMEYLPHTMEHDLPDGNYLKEAFIAGLIRQTLTALKEVHARGRVHLDVKPANLLYKEIDHIKLGDFGTMSNIGDKCIQLGDFCFMAPEVAYSEGLFTDRSDIWSVGVVALTLADGGPPLCREDPKLLMYIHRETCMVPSLWEPHKWSPEFSDFLSKCFIKDTLHRPSANTMLQHPWIAKAACDLRSLANDKYQTAVRNVRRHQGQGAANPQLEAI